MVAGAVRSVRRQVGQQRVGAYEALLGSASARVMRSFSGPSSRYSRACRCTSAIMRAASTWLLLLELHAAAGWVRARGGARPSARAAQAQARQAQQMLGGVRQRAEAVDELGGHLLAAPAASAAAMRW